MISKAVATVDGQESGPVLAGEARIVRDNSWLRGYDSI